AQRVAVVRAEVQHLALGDLVHALLRAAERAEWKPAADALGQRDEIGLHADGTRRTAPSGGDAGFDLVEDQQCAVLASDLADGFEVPGLWQADTDVLHHRLDDEARHVATLQRL